jgi:hypothetical protein
MFNYVFNLVTFEQRKIENCMLPPIYVLLLLSEPIYYVQSVPFCLSFVADYKATKKGIATYEFRLTLLGN